MAEAATDVDADPATLPIPVAIIPAKARIAAASPARIGPAHGVYPMLPSASIKVISASPRLAPAAAAGIGPVPQWFVPTPPTTNPAPTRSSTPNLETGSVAGTRAPTSPAAMATQMAPHAPFTARNAHADLVAAALETRAAAMSRAEPAPADDRKEAQRHTNLPPNGISPD